MKEGFYTSVRMAELFFRVCKRYHINGQEDRLCLMREMTRRRKAKYIRDVEPLLKGKKVLKIMHKRS
jgi:hypothetical protein